MNKKKILIIVLVVVLVAGAVTGGIYAFQWQQSNSLTADVESVSSLNWDYWGDEMSSYGMVTNDYYQDVYLISGQTVAEVYVEEGQEVHTGDQLLAYDTTQTDLQLEMKELAIQTIENNITLAQRELAKLKAETPISETPEVEESQEEFQEEEPIEEEIQEEETPQMENGYYNYISADTVDAQEGMGKGTQEEPYVLLCAPGCYVEGGYLNALAESEEAIFVRLQIVDTTNNTVSNMPSWLLSSEQLKASGLTFTEDSRWSVETRQPIDPSEMVVEEPDIEEPDIEEPDMEESDIDEEAEEEIGHTASELAELIQEEEEELKSLDLQKRKAQLELSQMQKVNDEGVVLAEIDGVVKTVGDINNPPTDGSAFISISGSDGLYVTGYLSELQLDSVGVGTVVYANSWQSGKSFEATIQEISPYPSDSNNSWGDGNPNVSYYPYVAYIEDTDGLKNGEYVDLTMTASNDQDDTTIYLEKAYVRSENGRSYVMKAGEDGRLVKQYVETGKIIYGEAVEIKSGLSMSDSIAFPYGKAAKEGVKVEGDLDDEGYEE